MGDCGDYKVRDTWTRLFPTKPFPQIDTLSAHELYSIGLFFSEYKLSYPVITGSKYILGLFVYSKPINHHYINPYFMMLIHDPRTNTYILDEASFHYALSSKWLDGYKDDSEFISAVRQEFKQITEKWRASNLVDCVLCVEKKHDDFSPDTLIQCNKCNNCFAHKECIDKWKENSKKEELSCPRCLVPIDHTHAWGPALVHPIDKMNIESQPLQLSTPPKDCNVM
jgi:hypothetical protein